MIPRLHPRGTSFKGACDYILHDPEQATSSDRVEWVETRNLSTKDPNWAWHEMKETFENQDDLKAASGQSARGRKNNKPVLHYSLSWHKDDNPTPEEMKEAAAASLRVLGLREHEALIAAHRDKDHMHLHIVVNTVHPETGMTAPLKFTKLDLSKWAEGYELLNGLHCEARLRNNAERARLKTERQQEAMKVLTGIARGERVPKRVPYVPVKNKQKSRTQWFDRQEIIDRMKAMRAEIDKQQKAERSAHWERHLAERDQLDDRTEAATDEIAKQAKEHYRPHWRNLYRAQKREVRYLRESLAYEAKQKELRPVSAREAMEAINRPDPMTELLKGHEQARRTLARQQREDMKIHTDAIMAEHRTAFEALRERQAAERQAEGTALFQQSRTVTFDAAKRSLIEDQQKAERPFKRAAESERAQNPEKPTLEQRQDRASERDEARRSFTRAADKSQPATPSRADQIRRDMAEWRKKNGQRDIGREM